MPNLIITIIGIALLGVLTAWFGINYGGVAFHQAQHRAVAATLISQTEQIARAWNNYRIESGGADLTDLDWSNGSADLSPRYLPVIPIPPPEARAFGDPGGGATMASSGGYEARVLHDFSSPVLPRSAISLSLPNMDLCRLVVEVAYGSGATPTQTAFTPPFNFTPPAGRRIDCVYYNRAGNDYPWLVYRM